MSGRLLVEISNPPPLKEVAMEMLGHPGSLFYKVEEGDIWWWDMELDVEVFGQVCQIILDTKEYSDELYVSEVLPKIIALLEKAPLFTALNSSDIQVTAGHKGTTPYIHTVNVAKEQRTSGLQPWQVVVVRLDAFYHDVGKAASVGLPPEIIQLLYDQKKLKDHSHPSHAEISLSALDVLLSRNFDSLLELSRLSPLAVDALRHITLNHHIFQDLQKHWPVLSPECSVEEAHHIRQVWLQTSGPIQNEIFFYSDREWMMLLMIFAFGQADLGSTPEYRRYWLGKNAEVAALLESALPRLNREWQIFAIQRLFMFDLYE